MSMALSNTTHYSITDEEFSQFKTLLYDESGITLSEHKKTLLVSRLTKRLRKLELKSFTEYYNYVVHGVNGGEEFVQMLDLLSTNKTDFFREPKHFEFLAQTIVPELASQRKIRIWSSACSSGEEPYSIAITLCEAMGAKKWDCKILASDLSTRVLSHAANGIYEKDRVKDLDSARLRRFFLKGKKGDKVKAKKEIAQMIAFKRINLMNDDYPIKSALDLIFCRNVMIYFDKETQERLVNNFYRYLKPNGYLFIGHSESLQWLDTPFVPIAPTIYQKKDVDEG